MRLKGVIDGNQVNIPEPRKSDEVQKLYMLIGLYVLVESFQEITFPYLTLILSKINKIKNLSKRVSIRKYKYKFNKVS